MLLPLHFAFFHHRVWGEVKGHGDMPEIPAPPYQKLYSGYRYAGDATPKTAAMDFHGRPMESIISSSLCDGEVTTSLSNTGLRVSQIVPQVPEQASYSTQRKRESGRKITKKTPRNDRLQQIEIQRFAWSFLDVGN